MSDPAGMVTPLSIESSFALRVTPQAGGNKRSASITIASVRESLFMSPQAGGLPRSTELSSARHDFCTRGSLATK